jgi:hypothetical protein
MKFDQQLQLLVRLSAVLFDYFACVGACQYFNMDQETQSCINRIVLKMLKKKLGLKNLFRRRTKKNGVKRGGISPTKTDSTACSSPGRGIDLAAFDEAIDRLPDRSGRSGLLETTSYDVPNMRSMSVIRKTISESGMDEYSVLGDEVDRYFVRTESDVTGFASESVATGVTMDWVSDRPPAAEGPSDEDSVGSLEFLMQHMMCAVESDSESESGQVEMKLTKDWDEKESIILSVMTGFCS